MSVVVDTISSSDYEEIFQPLLNDMWAVLREQLETVKMQGELVRVSCYPLVTIEE